jgi:hypothetical protein
MSTAMMPITTRTSIKVNARPGWQRIEQLQSSKLRNKIVIKPPPVVAGRDHWSRLYEG